MFYYLFIYLFIIYLLFLMYLHVYDENCVLVSV